MFTRVVQQIFLVYLGTQATGKIALGIVTPPIEPRSSTYRQNRQNKLHEKFPECIQHNQKQDASSPSNDGLERLNTIQKKVVIVLEQFTRSPKLLNCGLRVFEFMIVISN
ncbi:hypothetical protein P3T76_008938 [Phytophthora citrophthora]|uniref:Uncharacterized protein n=1 Tax=Phytophthora citrophthora TaxID=4793 RepID=A0AAD9GI79_9STRA|nr:hypothetical protein P3T76_008938 [Phytophthora citrophthora]